MPVKDINPGKESSNLGGLIRCGDTVFFEADDGSHGVQLWVSDGTEEGTLRVTDIPDSQAGLDWLGTPLEDILLFAANDFAHGLEPWRVDLALFRDGFEQGSPSAWSMVVP